MKIKLPAFKPGWLWNSSRAQIALGIILLVGLLAWLAPRPVEQIVTVSDSEFWRSELAPSIREVLWETPAGVPGLDKMLASDGSTQLVTPHLTDNGATLYFSRRVDGGRTDIFVTRLVDGQWQAAHSVSDLNSGADDLGLIVGSGGQEIYFYSNRPGGLGGTDLYVSQRTESGWSTPKNAGAAINSTADEYDPALAPDGRSIYFASNRNDSPVPQQRTGANGPLPWNTTLRAQRDRITFDLYAATRSTVDSPWTAAALLTEISEATASEGAPFVSPDGSFLYFASDRPVRDGEPRNLDLFRTRLTNGRPGEVTNLGAGINSPADETEPALSPEGFTLVFSSNRDGADRLYSSRSREIVRRTTWDTSHVPAFRNAWVLVPALLMAAILAWLIWQRDKVVDRLWPARFFLGSVMINMLLLFLLAVWKFPAVLDVVKKVFEESVPAPEMLDENEHQSHEDGREAYEKVADLKSLEAEAVPEAVRQVTDPQSFPEQTKRLTPTVSADVARALPPEQVLFVQRERPQETPPTPAAPSDSPLTRRRPRPPVEMAAVPDVSDVPLPEEALPDGAAPPEQTTVAVTPSKAPMTLPAQLAAATDPAPAQAEAAKLVPTKVAPTEPTMTTPVRVAANPFQRSPARQRPVTVAAAESDLPVLPGSPTVAQAESLNQAESTVERSVSKSVPGSPAATVAAAAPPMAVPAPSRVPPVGPAVRRQPDLTQTLPTELADPLSRRPRASRTVTAVASLDAALPDVAAATEIPAEQTVEGTRPEFQRSAAETTPPAGAFRTAAAETEIPMSRPATSTPIVAARTPVAEFTTPIGTGLPPKPLSRQRPGRQTESVLVAALDVDPVATGEGEVANEAEAVAAATAQVERKAVSSGEAAAAAIRAELHSLPEIDAAPLNPAPRRSAVTALASADVPRPASPLTRRPGAAVASSDLPMATPGETADVPMGDEAATANSVEADESALDRNDNGSQLLASVETPREDSGPSRSVQNRITIGELAQKSNDAPPAFSPIASRLNRKRARAMKVAFAEDNVGLQALFTLRQGDTRRMHIELLGGSEETEKAVSLGLEWLAKVQMEDGSWDLQKHQGSTKSNTAGTGLGLLPFLAAGYTHNTDGKYKEVVGKAVQWLLANQEESGELRGKGDSQRMYSHGIAAIALCEGFAMSQDEALKEPAQKALNFIIASQHQPSGGWRYNPNEQADTSVVGWQMMALKSGEMAGLKVPASSYQLVQKWLSSVESTTGPGGTFGYQDRNARPSMTAEGLLCLQFMGTRRDDPRMRYGADYLLKSLPKKDQVLTSYYWYYATQAMYHMQGDYWEEWNERTKEVLITTQETSGANAGSWVPRDAWENSGGRVYATSLKLLMLEVYYRHLPLYDQLEF
ncbi:MAG: hypothetical protein O2820_22465 [Planctomycetota bacterium]|nr:hypothetical protein [Planctomycetota bacterium]MDA1251983.1 hypothetical protein [Planctomycetota bacterium]